MALVAPSPGTLDETPPMTDVDESPAPVPVAPAPGRPPKPHRTRRVSRMPVWITRDRQPRQRDPRPAKPAKPRRVKAPRAVPSAAPGEPGAVLLFARKLALWAVALVVAAASVAAFAESYRGLLVWAQHHRYAGFWADVFPLQVDTFILIGEIALFVATVDRWRLRSRVGAWVAALVGLVVSVAGNIGHVGAHDLQSRATAAVPPVAAFAGLWLGLFILKQVIAHAPTAPAVPAEDHEAAPEIPPPPAIRDAAKAAYVASVTIGNPFSDRSLAAKFGITRPAAAQIRAEVAAQSGWIPDDVAEVTS